MRITLHRQCEVVQLGSGVQEISEDEFRRLGLSNRMKLQKFALPLCLEAPVLEHHFINMLFEMYQLPFLNMTDLFCVCFVNQQCIFHFAA